jgi:hypothetical protein
MFLRGLRSDLTTLCDCSTRCCRNISVATVITKAALLEQLLMSSSCEMIFLTRATNDVLDLDTEVDDGVVWSVLGISTLALSRQKERHG